MTNFYKYHLHCRDQKVVATLDPHVVTSISLSTLNFPGGRQSSRVFLAGGRQDSRSDMMDTPMGHRSGCCCHVSACGWPFIRHFQRKQNTMLVFLPLLWMSPWHCNCSRRFWLYSNLQGSCISLHCSVDVRKCLRLKRQRSKGIKRWNWSCVTHQLRSLMLVQVNQPPMRSSLSWPRTRGQRSTSSRCPTPGEDPEYWNLKL